MFTKARVFHSFIAAALTMVFSLHTQAATFKIATLSPDGSAWMVAMRKAGKELEKQTQGRVKLKFYPGGVMGDDKSALRKMKIRQLHGVAVSGGQLAKYFPDSQIYNLALGFRDFNEVDYVRSRMDEHILKGFEKNGFVSFGLAEGGFAYFMSNGSIKTPKDLKKHKVWAPGADPVTLKAATSLGITPIPLSIADVLPSLQTGLIDTVATSPVAALALQWHSQVTHITDLPLLYFYATLVVDKKAFKKLSPVDQTAMRTVLGATFKQIDKQNRLDNEAAFAAMKSQGISLEALTQEERSQWDNLGPTVEKLLVNEGKVNPETMKRMKGYLQDYRVQQEHRTQQAAK
ncbi:MAG: TRAP transporter substrate-binding protein DctP [Cellvibrionaceae bacterium]